MNCEFTLYLHLTAEEFYITKREIIIINNWLVEWVLVFPSTRSSAWPPALAPILYLPALAPNLYTLVSPVPGLAYTNLVLPMCIYWPWPMIFITVHWISIYLLIYSTVAVNINNSSNFLGLGNTNTSMSILVN